MKKPGTSADDEQPDEITAMLENNGADCGWLANLTRVSNRMHSIEWELVRRARLAEEKSKQSGEPKG